MYKTLQESPLASELQGKAMGSRIRLSLDQRMRPVTRKPNGVMTRLRSKMMDSYQSQRLWSQAPRKSMIQERRNVPEAEGGRL